LGGKISGYDAEAGKDYRSPLRIRSAMYCEAHIESNRMVMITLPAGEPP